MKKIITTSAILLLIVFSTSAISAKPTASPAGQAKRAEAIQKIEERKQALLEKRELIRTKIEEKKATSEARLAENKKQKVRAFWSRLEQRLTAVINRLEKLIERIESRIAKIEGLSQDIETEEISEQLGVAQASLDSTKIDLEAASTNIETVLSSGNPKEAFKEIRKTVKELKSDLVEVHRTLVQLIGDIKGLRVGASSDNNPEATNSASP